MPSRNTVVRFNSRSIARLGAKTKRNARICAKAVARILSYLKEGDEKFWALATFAGTTLVSPYLSLGALAGAWFYQPAPAAYRFRGKSPVAIEIYTHTYKSVYRRTALRGVLIGALGGSTLYYLTGRGYGLTFVRSW